MTATLTLDQAAKRAHVSRWTVSRALQAGRLLGLRDNRGRWRITEEEVDAWAAEQARTVLLDVQHRAEPEPAVHPLSIEVAVLQARLESAEARNAELARERDQWRQMAERLAEPKPRPGLLSRLLGRGRSQPA